MTFADTWAGRVDVSGELNCCGHDRGVPVVMTTPRFLTMGCGGLSLRGPMGGCANGMPLKESMPRKLDPTTVAESSVTTGPDCLFSNEGAAATRGSRHAAIVRREIMLDRQIG